MNFALAKKIVSILKGVLTGISLSGCVATPERGPNTDWQLLPYQFRCDWYIEPEPGSAVKPRLSYSCRIYESTPKGMTDVDVDMVREDLVAILAELGHQVVPVETA